MFDDAIAVCLQQNSLSVSCVTFSADMSPAYDFD